MLFMEAYPLLFIYVSSELQILTFIKKLRSRNTT